MPRVKGRLVHHGEESSLADICPDSTEISSGSKMERMHTGSSSISCFEGMDFEFSIPGLSEVTSDDLDRIADSANGLTFDVQAESLQSSDLHFEGSAAESGNNWDFALDPLLSLPLTSMPAPISPHPWPTDSASENGASEATPASSSSATCECLGRVAGIYEFVTAKLVWRSLRLPRDLKDILKNQKAALQGCEISLQCRTCVNRSSYILLVISICEKIMGSLERVVSGPQRPEPQDGFSQMPSEMTECQLSGNSLSQRDQMNTDTGEIGPNRTHDHGLGLSFGWWQLDDDDEKHVVHGLITARIIKLNQVVETIERLVNRQEWCLQGGMVRELRSRYLEISSQVSHKVNK